MLDMQARLGEDSPQWGAMPPPADRALRYVSSLMRARGRPDPIVRFGHYSYDGDEWFCVDCYTREGARHLPDCRV